MESSVSYRLAHIQDLERLALLFDAYRQFYLCPPDLAAAKNWLRLNFEKERSTIFVADTGSKLIGFTQLYPALCSVDLVKYFVLYDLYVVEGARRQGIARLLMNAASAWAKRQGAARLDLETARDNAAGQTLYRSLGYKLDEVFLKFSLDLTEPL
ncbi:MAG: GNAT family N-acetyltransferase [Luminiphilus sp.]|jgi:GNAT superfamily N-acetyltransferase|nr:GNAT family N-acetyltransferase [Luminiphilus sp.]